MTDKEEDDTSTEDIIRLSQENERLKAELNEEKIRSEDLNTSCKIMEAEIVKKSDATTGLKNDLAFLKSEITKRDEILDESDDDEVTQDLHEELKDQILKGNEVTLLKDQWKDKCHELFDLMNSILVEL